MRYIRIFVLISTIVTFFTEAAFAGEEVQYKKFNLESVTCDVGLLYRETAEGMDIGVSAIATGRGAELRKWEITGIKLNIGGKRFAPEATGKFYVKKESLFRVPAAVLFAAIGTQIPFSGSDLSQGISKAGAAIGFGLLVLAAKGEITGEKCVFRIKKDLLDSISEGRDMMEIAVEHRGMHIKHTVKIGIPKQPAKAHERFDYSKMGQDELLNVVDTLEAQASVLERNQAGYKYGVDPEYDELQRKIEGLQTERGVAYKTWFERAQKASDH